MNKLDQLLKGPPQLAHIDEAHCIGCTKCIQACPVDAILGAAQQMHAIIPDLCIGCEQCVAPCPTDCITMHAIPQKKYVLNTVQIYYKNKIRRTLKHRAYKQREHEKQRDHIIKQQYIIAALQRVQKKKSLI